jgi:spermidine synthase
MSPHDRHRPQHPGRLFSLPSPSPAGSTLRFLEPPNTCPDALWDRLFKGSYDKPFIVDARRRRFLHFDLDAVQSAMDLSQPERLCLAYTRSMMAFLLFNRCPRNLLLLGLGGGSLARFCHRHLPDTRITVVELNEHVLSLREEFHVPADDARFRVIHTDAATYVAQSSPCQDIVLADACNRAGIAPELDNCEFYSNAFGCLAPEGIFVANLCGSPESLNAHFLKIRETFGEQWLALPVRPDGNIVVFAFRGEPPTSFTTLEAVAPDLKRQFGLDFPRYVQRIMRASRLRARRQPLLPDLPVFF